MRNRCFSLSMVLLGICLFIPQKSLAQSTISCNSDDERRHSCAVDTRGGVRLATQHSGSACTEGYSWGSDNQGIWVDHGCRAEFTVGANRDYRDQNRNDQYGGNVQSQSQTIACNSDDMGRHSCSVDTRGGVRLLTQRSGSACTEGYSWGADNQGIWVDHGCRADFSVGGNRNFRDENRNDQYGGNKDYRDQNRNDQYGGNRQSQRIACNSDDMRRHSCAVDTRGGVGVRLLNQRSDAPCTKDYSWGTNRRGIWVDHGCRADFVVTTKYRQDSWR
ncbi:MAG TPA: DUF3011 domain-containing protein [Candidatus Acidoferrum sp.]|nr:DUF3011 domain-containing protein [Candidatus Acidoferrum sp.]